MTATPGVEFRGESSLAFDSAGAVARYCNMARFGTVLLSRDLELPLDTMTGTWPRDPKLVPVCASAALVA